MDTLARRSTDGTALVGGSPFRVLKLSAVGSDLLDMWLGVSGDGEVSGGLVVPEQDSPQAQSLWKRLVDAGIVHPTPRPATEVGKVAAVIPVLNDVAGLAELLPPLRDALSDGQPIIVVDDGSTNSDGLVALATKFGAEIVRHDQNVGPAAARNSGWAAIRGSWPDTTAVLFIDADVVIEQWSLAQLVANLEAEPDLGVVAPRVVARSEPGALHAYESVHSPLDMGAHPARVEERTRVSYVPSATMLVQRQVLEDLGGFDADMRVGEDVDFVWRASKAGWSVRYSPEAHVHHRSRSNIRAMMYQRFAYGTSAAALEKRHPNHVFPVELSVAQLAVWGAALWGGLPGKVIAGAAVARSMSDLSRKLEPKVDGSVEIASKIVFDSHRFGLKWLANAATRAWGPLLLLHRTTRRGLLAAFVIPGLIDWWAVRGKIDPMRFMLFRVIDHVGYCAGLWEGAKRHCSLRSVLPRFRRL